MESPPQNHIARTAAMVSLIFAGESVFLPAFHLNRYFKTSLMATFGINEQDIGGYFVVYGVVAMVSYFLGGPLADRFPPRWLMAGALVATGLGSLYMATVPPAGHLPYLFGFWGATTILTFWAALIRATHDWAQERQQGRAFGILDGGRGLAAALIATGAARAFGKLVGDRDQVPLELQTYAVERLLWLYAACCFVSAAAVVVFVKSTEQHVTPSVTGPQQPLAHRLRWVMKSPAVWLQAVVILAAYSALKMMDNYGIYAEQVFGYTEAQSADLTANISYIRVGAALGAGYLADKLIGVRLTILSCSALLLFSYLLFVAMPTEAAMWPLMVANMAVSCVGFFALRGVYFALVEETGTPHELTGTAVGVICFVGFLPEIYMGALSGWLIHSAREAGDVLVGYQQCFAILAVFAGLGVAAAIALHWFVRPRGGPAP